MRLPSCASRAAFATLLLAASGLAPAPVHADERAPSLAARTDRRAPWVAHGASIDVVAQGFRTHGVRLDASLNRYFGVLGMPAWRPGVGPVLGVGLSLHPQGKGLEGLELALVAEALWRPAEGNVGPGSLEGSLSFEAGYRWVFQGAQLGLVGGAQWMPAAGPHVGPVVRLLLGWAV